MFSPLPMTVTKFGYCPRCDVERVELVPTAHGMLQCHKCGSCNWFKNKKEYQDKYE